MKKYLSIFAALTLSAAVLSSCGGATKTAENTKPTEAATAAANAGEAPDYSKKECWFQIPEITKDVDTFFVVATEYIQTSFDEGAPDYAALDNAEMKKGMENERATQASTYEDSTNVFIPYYRQSGLKHAADIAKKNGTIDEAISGMPYDDITAALDYYFENYNNGRPFIIAAHSQGSAIVKLALKNYFKEHSDYYERMVAAYVIGYSVTKDDLAQNPHMKFAAGETDTGVIVSWNTEGPKNAEENAHNVPVLPGAISINPLNWKLDDTYAPASENKGSLKANEKTGEPEIGDVGADAQLNLERGVVVTHAEGAPVPENLLPIFGPDNRHAFDYTFYYNNIKDNVAKRIAAYKESH